MTREVRCVILVAALLGCQKQGEPRAVATTTASAPRPIADTSDWLARVDTGRSPMGDPDKIRYSVTSFGRQRLRDNDTGEAVLLGFSCTDGKVEGYASASEFLREDGRIRTRVDSAPAINARARAANTPSAVVIGFSDPRSLLAQLAGSHRLLVEMETREHGVAVSTFKTSGAAAITESVMGDCLRLDSIRALARADSARAAQAAVAARTPWIGDRSTHLLYHKLPSCTIVGTVAREDRITFPSKEVALAAGYRLNGYESCGGRPE